MKVKRFEAPNTKSALALVKEELGSDAVILSTKTLPPEPGRPPVVEVVAAVDFDVETVSRQETRSGGNRVNGHRVPQVASDRGRGEPRPGEKAGAPTTPPRRGAWRPQQEQPRPAALAAMGAADAEEATVGVNLSREARLLQQRFAGCNSYQLGQQGQVGARERQGADTMSVSPTLSGRAADNNGRPGHSNHPGRQTAAAAPAINDKNRRPSQEEVMQWRNRILEQLAVHPLQLDDRGEPLIIALVGPTGVGKTTTAAKIAAWFSLHENARVALLSMDCYRIGATDQLRTYARIMRLPCEIALRQQDLNAALHKHRHKDLIIIDTAGKSPFDEDHIPELVRWFAEHGAIIPYLVLSATAKKEDLNHIIAAYRPLGVPAAILTKLDETRAYAALCQQMAKAELPIACLCTGQKVPEDFLPADKDFLKTLFGDGWSAAMRQQEATVARDGWLAQ